MATEQQSVSPATAGGAPAPTIPPAQVRATAEYLARMVDCAVVDAATQRGVSTSDQLRPVADKLHALLGEEPCVMATVRHRHLITLVDGVRKKLLVEQATRRDPRDAEIERLRGELDLMARALATIRGIAGDIDEQLTAPDVEPAEPRRWVAGDAEPAIGTTVRQSGDWGSGPTYTRRTDGLWYRQDDQAAFIWAHMTAYTSEHPLVEVVSTDGD